METITPVVAPAAILPLFAACPMTLTITPPSAVSPLLPHLPYCEDETVVSYVARLSRFHTGQGISRLAGDIGLKVTNVLNCQEHALAVLASASGTQRTILEKGVIRTETAMTYYAGDRYHARELRSDIRRICPLCLMADGAPVNWRHRIFWCFSAAHSCPEHQCDLVELEGGSHDLREVLTAQSVEALCREARARVAARHQRWLLSRITGATNPEPAWLTKQSTRQVLRMLLHLGAVLNHGAEVRVSSLSRQEAHDARETAYDIAASGEAAIFQALDKIRSRSSARATQAGPLAVYGALYRWLDSRTDSADPGPIKQLIRTHILRNFALGAGEVILGKPVTKRRFHSMVSLSQETGIPRKRIGRLLQTIGLVPEGATDAESGTLIFKVEETERIITAHRDALPLEEVAGYLGASEAQIATLRKLKILTPLFSANRPGQLRKLVFARADLDRLLAKWKRAAVVTRGELGDMRSLTEACQQMPMPMEVLLREVSTGSVRLFRDADVDGLKSLRVRLSDLASPKAAA